MKKEKGKTTIGLCFALNDFMTNQSHLRTVQLVLPPRMLGQFRSSMICQTENLMKCQFRSLVWNRFKDLLLSPVFSEEFLDPCTMKQVAIKFQLEY